MKYDPRVNDILLEYVNIGMGKAAEVLNSILSSHIHLAVPALKLIESVNLFKELELAREDSVSLVRMGYEGEISGKVELIFSTENASKLVDCLTGEGFDDVDMDIIRSGTLCEVGNIVINGLMGTLSNLLETHFHYTVPDFDEGSVMILEERLNTDYEKRTPILLAKTFFNVEALKITGNIAVYFSMDSYDALMKSLQKILE